MTNGLGGMPWRHNCKYLFLNEINVRLLKRRDSGTLATVFPAEIERTAILHFAEM